MVRRRRVCVCEFLPNKWISVHLYLFNSWLAGKWYIKEFLVVCDEKIKIS